MQVAYGPTDNATKIVGPQSFITDGTRNLTMTCQATEVNPVPSYSWSGVICDEGNQSGTCTFRPKTPWDDGKRIFCTATNKVIGNPNPMTGETIFAVNLNYPPSDPPVIAGYTDGQILKSGDIITCTIFGGKPLVSAVIFKCSNPDLPDHADIKVGVTSLTSDVIVDTSQAKDGAPVCFCQGMWGPQQELYTKTKLLTIETEYKASVVRFSINGSSDVITLNENDLSDASLVCATKGRPKPNITLARSGDATALRQVNDVDELSFRMSRITCEKMGQYSCTADNGYPNPSQMSARLVVNCAPRYTQAAFTTANSQTPPKMTTHGLNLTLISYPTPSTFLYAFHQNRSASAGTTVTKNLFSTSCGQSIGQAYVALCEVRAAGELKKEDFGVYSVALANGVSSLNYYFNVDVTVVPRAATSTDGGQSEGSTSIAAVAGGAAAGGVFVIFIVAVVVVFIVKGKKKQGETNEEQQKSSDDDPVIEEHENVAYVSADKVDKNASQSSPRKKSPEAVPLSSGRSSSGYDYVSGYVPEQKQETETDFGYASVNAGNVESSLSVGYGATQRPNSDMYESVNEGPNTSPTRNGSEAVEYAVVEINGDNTGKGTRSQPTFQNNEYADIDTKSPRDYAETSNSDVRGGQTTVGPLGDLYTTVDRASKKKKKIAFRDDPTTIPDSKGTRGPLGDVYAQVHKAPRGGNSSADRDSQPPIPKPKGQSKPGFGSQFSQSAAATDTVQDPNSGASHEDMSRDSSVTVPAAGYEEIALASLSTRNSPQVTNNGVGEGEYNSLNFSERDPTTSDDPNDQYSHIHVS